MYIEFIKSANAILQITFYTKIITINVRPQYVGYLCLVRICKYSILVIFMRYTRQKDSEGKMNDLHFIHGSFYWKGLSIPPTYSVIMSKTRISLDKILFNQR